MSVHNIISLINIWRIRIEDTFIGDIYGNPGRKAVKECVPQLRKELGIDFCIANGENAAAGSGITYLIAQELYKAGVDCITMGNHTWSKKEI